MIDKLREINDERWLQIIKKAPDFFRGFKSDLFEISETNWEDNANQLMHDLNQLNTPVWFLLDEFPILVDKIANRHGKDEAFTALYLLRRMRLHHTGGSVRFLLTGSIGLDNVMACALPPMIYGVRYYRR